MKAIGTGAPFLIVYYGSDAAGGWQGLDRPLRTITTIDRFGLVTWADAKPYLRMLQVPELMRAMGFGTGYDLQGIGSRRDRIRLLGNGVAPPVMEAVVRTLLRRKAVPHAAPDRHARSTAINGRAPARPEKLTKFSSELASANLALPDDEDVPALCAE